MVGRRLRPRAGLGSAFVLAFPLLKEERTESGRGVRGLSRPLGCTSAMGEARDQSATATGHVLLVDDPPAQSGFYIFK